jgi:hypothetical protein
MIKDEFKNFQATRWAIWEFKRRGLTSFFHLATNTAYQHHVNLFYQNLSYNCERSSVISTSLDGVDLEVTPTDIVLTLGCPHECPPDLVKRDGTPRYSSPLLASQCKPWLMICVVAATRMSTTSAQANSCCYHTSGLWIRSYRKMCVLWGTKVRDAAPS